MMRSAEALRHTHDQLLEVWGFEGHGFARAPRIMLLDAPLVRQLRKDLSVLGAIITRLAPGGGLTIGATADRFTHGVGRSPSRVPTPFIARPDLILRNGQPKILELNVDSSLGGTAEVSILADAYRRSGYFDRGIDFNSPLDALADFLGPICGAAATRADRARLLILTSRQFRDYDQANARVMAEHIAARARIECVVGYPDELEVSDQVRHQGEHVDAMLKLDVIIDDCETSAFADLLNRAGASRTAIISDNRYVNVEDKAAIALLRLLVEQDSPILSAAEKEVIARITVPTRLLSMPPPNPATDWLTHLDHARDRLVLKRCFSFGGSAVVCGLACSRNLWLERCAAALESPSLWVVQDYVEGDALIFDNNGYGRAVAGADVQEDWSCVVSPFVYGDQIGGFLCRVSRSPGNPIVGLASGSRTAFYMVGEMESAE